MDGKVTIVTGASRGLGKRIAQVLAGTGATVVLTARPPATASAGQSPLDTVAADIVAAGGNALAVYCDSSSEAAVANLTDDVLARFGRIDVLVNNAAIRLTSTLLDTPAADLEQIFRINVLGPFLMWRHVVPAMIAQGSGNVINLSSTNAVQQPFIGMGPYRMTKVALTYLSADLALELRDDRVAVNAFDPGAVVSEGTTAARAERVARYGGQIHYHAQDPVEVLDAPITWLAAQTADTFTGQFVRRVDFGRTWGPGAPGSDESAR